MSQSPIMSLAESVTNVVAGFIMALTVQILLFRAMGLVISLGENIAITLLFASISLIRGYIVRRLFNALTHWQPREDRP